MVLTIFPLVVREAVYAWHGRQRRESITIMTPHTGNQVMLF